MTFRHTSCALLLVISLSLPTLSEALSLQECLQKTRDNSPALKSSAWEVRIAGENSRLAAAALYPRLDALAGYTMQLEPQAVKMGGVTAETQEPDFAFAGISATYTLYDFGRRDARIRQAYAYKEAAEQNHLSGSGDISLQVIETYFHILETEKRIAAATEEIAQITEHRRMAQVLLEEGVVTRNDVLQADVRLASAQQKKLTVSNVRENAWLRLNFLIGNDLGFRDELDGTVDLSYPVTSKPNRENGGAERHDIKAQKLLLEAREAEIQENRENYYPEIYSRVGMDYVQNDKVREQAIFAATVGIRVNLFDGYASQTLRERAVKRKAAQTDALRLTEMRAELEISTARNDADVARMKISVAESAIRQSEENLRINKERYLERVGIASEVLDAQALLTQAKTDYYRALYDFQTASARVRNALGAL